MRMWAAAFVAIVGLSAGAEGQIRIRVTESAGGGDLASKALVTSTTLTYVGAFKTPDVITNQWSGESMAYYLDGATPTLFLEVGLFNETKVLQMNIPTPINTSNAALLNSASVVAGGDPVDVTDGNMAEFLEPLLTGGGFGNYRMWGLLAYGGRLCGASHLFYDASGEQRRSHFCRSLDLTDNTAFEGWDVLWDSTKARHAAGGMALIPDYAQSALGGPVLASGPNNPSILAFVSAGPAAFAFNPADISGRTPNTVSAQALMWYDLAHPSQENIDQICDEAGTGAPGCADDPSEYWTKATHVGGVVIPYGYRSALYFMGHGYGDKCYGVGTADPELHGDPLPPPNELQQYCYNPRGVGAEGEHAYPYRYQIAAYDLLDFAAVKAGTKLHWEVQPYSVWEIALPTAPSSTAPIDVGNVAYDVVNKALYVPQLITDNPGGVARPIIHKFTHP